LDIEHLAAAVNSHIERLADLAHSFFAEPPEAVDEDGGGDALDGVEVDG
jgi:hypothetical protein